MNVVILKTTACLLEDVYPNKINYSESLTLLLEVILICKDPHIFNKVTNIHFHFSVNLFA